MKQYKYIGNISIGDLKENIVHACINEDGYRCILIKNSIPKTVVSKYETDNLIIKLNSILFFEEKGYYFHIITSKKNDFDSINGFELVYDYIFKKIQYSIPDTELASLVFSLEEFFRITPERDNQKLQIGVWGELFCIKNLYNAGYSKIVAKYHDNFFLKHDIEINENIRVEIKTTTNQKRIHHFRQDQINRDDIEVFVISIILEEVEEGTSLWNMFNYVANLMDSPDSVFALQKVIKMCGISEEKQGPVFSETKAKQDLRYFYAKELPRIQGSIPQGVTNVEYDVDCAMSNFISEKEFINCIR